MKPAIFTDLRKATLGIAIVAGLASASLHAAPVSSARDAQVAANPYSPAYKHPYRHGVIPNRQVQAAMKRWSTQHLMALDPNTLSYGGGIGGVGVLSGQSRVYLVFYGNQWGTQGTDANGYLTFSGDTNGSAVAAQKMFTGIGTNGELWSAELTQWCDGSGVATGAVSCPAPSANVKYIPYQQNVLAGTWYDNAAASPAAATAAQLANEAVAAAAHFGNTATGSNRYTYYVILSPKGTNPDSYQGNYCAWHDYTGDPYFGSINPPGGHLAFSNQPYNTDSGSGCGVNFLNGGAAGTLDGYTMTLGHEWHETLSDQFPRGGWTNSSNGNENSDECAWIAGGSPGGAANITFSTGTFAQQASWSNDTNSCAISHAILVSGNNSPTANFSFTTNKLLASFTDSSSDSDGTIASHAWDFGDGATSTATNPNHTYGAGSTYSVTETVSDDDGATASKTTPVTVAISGGNLLHNGVAATGLGTAVGGQLMFKLTVPAGASGLSFVQPAGGTGDSDMYVRFGSAPTLSTYDCRPYLSPGTDEVCSFDPAQTGTYYVMLNGYTAFSGISVVGSYSLPMSSGTGLALPIGHVNQFSDEYTFDAPDGASTITISISGGTGNADLYVRRGLKPTINLYSCRPMLAGNNETCTFNSKKAGTYLIRVLATTKYTGVTLTATHTP